jgi:hypothetical protein
MKTFGLYGSRKWPIFGLKTLIYATITHKASKSGETFIKAFLGEFSYMGVIVEELFASAVFNSKCLQLQKILKSFIFSIKKI